MQFLVNKQPAAVNPAAGQPFGQKTAERLATRYDYILVQTHDARRYALRPNLCSQAGFLTNDLGLRSQELPDNNMTKRPVSVAFLGDSVVMGSKVESNADLFSEQIKKASDMPLLTLNGGCSCYNAQQMLGQLNFMLRHHVPDVAFLHCTVNEVTLGAQLGEDWKEGLSWSALFGFDDNGRPAARPVLNQTQPVPARAIQSLYKNLLLCVSCCLQQGVQPLLVTAPRLLGPNCSNEYLRAAAQCGHDLPVNISKEKYLGASLDLANACLKKLSNNINVPLVDLAGQIDSLPYKEKLFLDYFHFNPLGHRLVANLFAKHLKIVLPDAD